MQQHPFIKVTFLGTGTSSGVPMIACDCAVCQSTDKHDKRLRSSILVQSATTTLVIDTTPDFRYQMLRTHTNKLDAVVFTHPHKDHLAGLDDVRAYNHFMQQPMQLFANDLTANAIKQEMHYAFTEHKYPGVPNLVLNHIDETAFIVGDIELKPIKVWHLKMPVLGFRIGDFTYITDANRIDEAEKQKILGSKVLVLNALRREKHISHFNLEEAIQLANELQVPETYFTHISHQLGKHQDINEELPRNIRLAFDGLVVSL